MKGASSQLIVNMAVIAVYKRVTAAAVDNFWQFVPPVHHTVVLPLLLELMYDWRRHHGAALKLCQYGVSVINVAHI